MFNEDEDWSDEEEPQIVVQSVPKGSKKADSSTHLKAVGKKSLLRTLQTLGSVPEWKDEDLKQDSDSEAEAASSPTKTMEQQQQQKKKRTYRRKRARASEEKEKGDAEETVKEEKPQVKKRKKDDKTGVPKVESESGGETKIEKTADSVQPNGNNPQSADKLSRKQWKSKMKNKKNCKNKYRQDQPEKEGIQAAEEQEPKKEVKKMNSDRNTSEKTRQTTAEKVKQGQPQKGGKGGEITEQHPAEKQINNRSRRSSAESEVEITEERPQISAKQQNLSKKQNLKREKLRKLLQNQPESAAVQKERPAEPEPGEEPEEKQEEKPSPAPSFRSRMEQRLDAARFRYINEVLYSSSSGEAKRMFKQDPQAFWVYHRGYTAQVQRWPQNPVDDIISYIRKQSPSLVVADFGCGDCKIARGVKNKVHSFDLAATCELATVCDMAHVPLEDGSVHIAVFCLSLMGTNLADFLAEANRVLKKGGILKIAEVASRFDNVRNFLNALARLGFKMTLKNTENTHFYTFDFIKTENAPENVKKFGLQLKPCLYKKR